MIDYDDLRDAIERMPEPTLGLKGGVNRADLLLLLDKYVCRCPEANNGAGYRHECPRHGDDGWDR